MLVLLFFLPSRASALADLNTTPGGGTQKAWQSHLYIFNLIFTLPNNIKQEMDLGHLELQVLEYLGSHGRTEGDHEVGMGGSHEAGGGGG